MKQTVTLPGGERVPALGQGTWYMGEQSVLLEAEIASIRVGIEHGMTLIDTAEMYGDGAAERMLGKALAGIDRESLFLVSKVYPWNAGRANIFTSLENSLRRMNTEYLDLYLLHWPGSVPLRETVECMEELKSKGKIRYWGVSNFDTHDMKKLWNTPGGEACAANQVLYHVGSRGIEYDLLPWMRERGIPAMAYCPLAQGGSLRRQLARNSALINIAQEKSTTVFAVMLAFLLAQKQVIAIPKASTPSHTLENAQAAQLCLSAEDLRQIDVAFPAPNHKLPLDMQ
ncbi:MAG: aldo/keto reductase [Christensenella sp.]|nr:aldo/keto reductase [Christensenella sp.]